MPGHTYVFVGGLHRSGTSLLARSLESHPAVSGFSDTGVPEDEGQHLQSVYPAGNQLGGAGRFAFSRGAHITEDSPLVTDANRERLLGEWNPHWDLTKPVLVEKSPPNAMRTRFLQAMFPESRFVVLTRHPIAVAIATSKWTRSSLPRMIEHWLRCYETLLEDAPHVEHLRMLRYEDLVTRPDEELADVERFIGLEPQPSGIEVRGGLNDSYFAGWKQRRRNPLRRLWYDRAARELEPRVNRFGYSLAPPRTLSTAETPSAGSTHSGA
jgi:hypothetical protein